MSGNTATANGGGISAAGSVSIVGSTIARNSAAVGGGLFREVVEGSFVSMSGTIVAANPDRRCVRIDRERVEPELQRQPLR